MEENKTVSLMHISTNPHIRCERNTGAVMRDVIYALIPATAVGVWRYGLSALLVMAMSVLACVASEFVFDYIAHKGNTVKDGSAIVTGLLLGLVLPPAVPLYIPFVGGIFAIIVVKCFFGGLGKNFMNPALAARCFLLISFGTAMIDYSTDTITGATPLAIVKDGGMTTINAVFLGQGTGIIGSCSLAVLLGGIYLLATGTITWEIPVSLLGSFAVFEILLGQVHSISDLLIQIFGGGIMLAAFFMATDMVTSPMAGPGQLIYGAFIGLMCSLFRAYGSAADSVSYAVIFANCITPLIDRLPAPKPLGVGIEGLQKDAGEKKKFTMPKSAIALCVITLLAGVALGGVNFVTRDTIAEQQLLKEAAAYLEVMPGATTVAANEEAAAVIESLGGEVYGTDYGKSYINEVWTGLDDAGNVVGYAFNVNNKEAFDGNIALAIGISTDGTVTGISFTEINETAGMGMRADEPEWKAQFAGKNVTSFTLNKAGNASSDEEINSISGASVTSGAVVKAVNAALGFFAENLAQ